jgi:murein DD-endopeptidase MepM/ murein hydrolase activator NlpD
MRLKTITILLLGFSIAACTRSAPIDTNYTPPAPLQNLALPTGAPPAILTYLPPTRMPGVLAATPTPNVPQILPTFTAAAQAQVVFETPTPGPLTHIVQPGEYPGSIAAQYGLTVDELLSANNFGYDIVIYPGDAILIPVTPTPGAPRAANSPQFSTADYFKIIPDSELVNGPLSSLLDVGTFVSDRGGYLAYYTQNVDGEMLTGAQIVERVARDYSVNPRLLLALLEYRSQWVTNPNPAPSTIDTPIGYVDGYWVGLYRQLAWSADKLNQGFYRWREGKIQQWNLADGSQIIPQPGINPGTAGVQNLFSYFGDSATWGIDTGPQGLFATYSNLFGYPFDWAIEPLLPAGLAQPAMTLPFAAGETWQFTGGPHGGWGSGAGWAALDFAPPGDPIGCGDTDAWVRAIASGKILRSENGSVLQELDNDGLEQTGWVVLYLHIATRDRVPAGTIVKAGDKIGHPSCEGGFTIAAHLHIARRYNGVWIPADDPTLPFVMDGWISSGNGKEYDGWLTKNERSVEAWDGVNPVNEIWK